ncbi:MAG: restriction endonuclease subunit S [Kiritimatiellae bacterium]|nr:restriction endonuclease subunit S [Kiritimatiellia bacterium]
MNRKVKLKNIAEIRNGYLSRSGIEADKDGGFCLVQLSDFDKDRTVLNTDKLIRFQPGKMRADQTIHEHDVLFLAKGANNFAFHPGPRPSPTLAAGYFYVLRPSSKLLPAYLAWFLNHPETTAIFKRIAGVGAHMPVIRKSALEDIEIPLPPLHEQKTIVALHAATVTEAELLEELKQARKTLIDHVTMKMAEQNTKGPTS